MANRLWTPDATRKWLQVFSGLLMSASLDKGRDFTISQGEKGGKRHRKPWLFDAFKCFVVLEKEKKNLFTKTMQLARGRSFRAIPRYQWCGKPTKKLRILEVYRNHFCWSWGWLFVLGLPERKSKSAGCQWTAMVLLTMKNNLWWTWGFLKCWYLQIIIHFNGIFHSKPSILG